MATPAIDGWFTTGEQPSLLGTRCVTCGCVYFPKQDDYCRNPGCDGSEFVEHALSRTGTVWSYTDAQYQPPPPYQPPPGDYRSFGLAAVELPEGITVLGQLADGYGVDDVHVGSPVELVVETLYVDDEGPRTIWRWKPTDLDGGTR
ncbi:Zn-ribbon domain-containing OB-fold protein [Nocardioides limicola]|uniref:Zn-ribbon domain-containing OB-fold protein n=1 Tax=Nocardioides limicola TaxID=2803368 RepID=UPI00193B71F4|nr:OB-fold domain-containing protein [Nocardioides sp. DJM-14]